MSETKNFNKVLYKNEFISKNYDRVNLTMPKGKKDIIKKHAQAKGESVNSFINRAIDETIERDALKYVDPPTNSN